MVLKSDCTIDLTLRLWQPVSKVSVSGLGIQRLWHQTPLVKQALRSRFTGENAPRSGAVSPKHSPAGGDSATVELYDDTRPSGSI